MTRTEETYLNWITGSYSSMSSYLYFMAKGMIEELGEKQGKELFVKQIYAKGKSMGIATKKALQERGIEPSFANARAQRTKSYRELLKGLSESDKTIFENWQKWSASYMRRHGAGTVGKLKDGRTAQFMDVAGSRG